MMNNYSYQDFLSVARRITYDATIPELLEEAVRNHEGRLSNNGAILLRVNIPAVLRKTDLS